MKYRNSIPKDAECIANVLVKSYNIKDLKEGREIFNNEIKKQHHYIVAVEQGKIIGIVTWIVNGLPKHGLCELDRIAVLQEYQGKGIARDLFNKLIETASKEYKKHGFKLRKLFILTHADNKRAQSFYKKMGCSYETTLKTHYYKDKDEFVYSRFFEK
ncbi:MAG: GNAT family N-acetyltransferase [Nanoarchaeota archaeon]